MSVVRQPVSPATDLRNALRQATALGCEFRIVGAGVEITGLCRLPAPLMVLIERHRDSGFLYSYLGGDDLDNEALEFARGLGVEPVLVETREQAIAAVAEMTDRCPPHIGVDIETAPLPQHAQPRPAIDINADGGLSGIVRKRHYDNTALDPNTSQIATLQLYAGGPRAFVFRGTALGLMLRSRWLRQQHLVAHNAGFELKIFASPHRSDRGSEVAPRRMLHAGGRSAGWHRFSRRGAQPGQRVR